MPTVEGLVGVQFEFSAEALLKYFLGQAPLPPMVQVGDATLSCMIHDLRKKMVVASLVINGVPHHLLIGAVVQAEFTLFQPAGNGAQASCELIIGRAQGFENYDPTENVYLTVKSIPEAALR